MKSAYYPPGFKKQPDGKFFLKQELVDCILKDAKTLPPDRHSKTMFVDNKGQTIGCGVIVTTTDVFAIYRPDLRKTNKEVFKGFYSKIKWAQNLTTAKVYIYKTQEYWTTTEHPKFDEAIKESYEENCRHLDNPPSLEQFKIIFIQKKQDLFRQIQAEYEILCLLGKVVTPLMDRASRKTPEKRKASFLIECERGIELYEILHGSMRHIYQISYKDRLEIAIASTVGLKELHIIGIIHCDIKIENIMVDLPSDSDENIPPAVALIDFNCSLIMDPKTKSAKHLREVGTQDYIAPEIVKQKGVIEYRAEADIFSLGQVFLYLFEDNLSDWDKNVMSTLGYQSTIDSLIARMKNPEPQERPSLEEIWQQLIDLKLRYKKHKKQIFLSVSVATIVGIGSLACGIGVVPAATITTLCVCGVSWMVERSFNALPKPKLQINSRVIPSNDDEKPVVVSSHRQIRQLIKQPDIPQDAKDDILNAEEESKPAVRERMNITYSTEHVESEIQKATTVKPFC